MKTHILWWAGLIFFTSHAHAEISARPLFVDVMERLDKLLNYIDEDLERRRQVDGARARFVSKGAKPEVTIRRTGIGSSGDAYFADGIVFNGERIGITDPPSRAIELLGRDFRVYQGHYVWDRLGIRMHVETPSQSSNNKPREEYTSSISVHLNAPPPGAPVSPAEPAYYFSGHLELDGAGIDSETKIWELRALVDRSGLPGGRPYIICLQSRTVCEVQHNGDERSDEVSFWTDKDHANGKIYSVTYSYRH